MDEYICRKLLLYNKRKLSHHYLFNLEKGTSNTLNYPDHTHYTDYSKSSLVIVTTTTLTDWKYLKDTTANDNSIFSDKNGCIGTSYLYLDHL